MTKSQVKARIVELIKAHNLRRRLINTHNKPMHAKKYKEGKEGYFSLVADSRTYAIISCSLERPSIYARQAAAKITELCSKNTELPVEAKSVWC